MHFIFLQAKSLASDEYGVQNGSDSASSSRGFDQSLVVSAFAVNVPSSAVFGVPAYTAQLLVGVPVGLVVQALYLSSKVCVQNWVSCEF